jgi:Ca2+-binding RTX toxin-like protein
MATYYGTVSNDVLTGSSGNDFMYGLEGNDQAFGGLGIADRSKIGV